MMDKTSAEAISNEMLLVAARLDQSVALIVPHLSEGEADAYKLAVGELMGLMLIDFLNPIYETYPELKPEQLK
jgi:hypothetical protein